MAKEKKIPGQSPSDLVAERTAILANKGTYRRRIVGADGTVYIARDAGAFVDNVGRDIPTPGERTTPAHLSGTVSPDILRKV